MKQALFLTSSSTPICNRVGKSHLKLGHAVPRRNRKILNIPEAAPSAASAAAGKQMLVYVPPHPLVKHFLTIARNESTPPSLFRAALGELGRILIYEAGKDFLPTVETPVTTPVGQTEGTIIDPTRPVKVVPILRAGLVLQEQISSVLPNAITYHVGCSRNEDTLEVSEYFNNLPPSFSKNDLIMILDPMLATGGTIIRTIEDVVKRGAQVQNIRVISVVASPTALQKLSPAYPGMAVYAAMIDPELNDKGYIIPGLGDAGDRAFGT